MTQLEPLHARPMVELVDREVLESISGTMDPDERRQGKRYPLNLPAVMTVDGTDYAVACLDVGDGGIMLLTSHTVSAAQGARVTVRTRIEGQLFQTECQVVNVEKTPQGTILNLSV